MKINIEHLVQYIKETIDNDKQLLKIKESEIIKEHESMDEDAGEVTNLSDNAFYLTHCDYSEYRLATAEDLLTALESGEGIEIDYEPLEAEVLPF